MARILFLKANPFHDARGRFTFAPSGAERGGDAAPQTAAEINSEAEADAYWLKRFANRTYRIPREEGRILVRFDAENDHAYTKDEGGRQKRGLRVWAPERARRLDFIPPTLMHGTVWGHGADHLFVALTDDAKSYICALGWDSGRKRYFLRSAYPLEPQEWEARRKAQQLKRVKPFVEKTPMTKAMGVDTALQAPTGQWPGLGESPPGVIAFATAVAPDFDLDHWTHLCKAIPSGARWITVRPNGPGSEGHPVLIQPASDGAFHVIGGAGGKLNYLKLTGVRSEAEYAERAKESAKTRREEKKKQAARDRAAGISGQKQQAREQLKLAERVARDDFVKKVGAALGWKPEDTSFRHEDHQDVPQSQLDQMEAAHFDKLYRAAEEAVTTQRQRLVADADMRADAGLSAIPLAAPEDPAQLTVADLDPIDPDASGRGLGFQPKYEERAATRGAAPEEIQEEAREVAGKEPKPAEAPAEQPELPGTPAPEEKPDPAAEVGEKIGEALPAVREPIGPKVDPKQKATAKQAMELLRAQKELREKLKQVKTRRREIDNAASAGEIEPRAFVIEVDGKAVDEATVRGVEEELRTVRTKGFLDEAARQDAASLNKHVAVGAFNSLNSLALAAGGSGLMDRSVVDVLGPEAAAQALVHRLATDLPPDGLAHVREAMGQFHVQHYMAASQAALEEARDLQEQASEIQLGEASNGDDLAVVQELNQRRRELTNRSKAILAQTLGEMETNAALVTAFEKPQRDRVSVSLGDMAPADAIVRLRAIGLDRGDYQMERAGRSTLLVINGPAIGKLTAPINRADIERVNGALAIMQGHQDEDGWLPEGVASRPDFGREAPEGVAPRLARPFPASPADVGQAVRDYIGGRAADGDAPADIMAGLLAEDVIQRSGDRDAFMAAVNEVAPLYGEDGKMIRAEAHADRFQQLADEFTSRVYGGKRLPIHRQTIEQDTVSAEALHRALARTPEGAAAFKPVGDLSSQEQGALRQMFEREFASKDPAAAEKRQRLAALDAKEPEKETEGLLGRQPNPDWTDWKRERDEAAQAANAASMSWPRYVEAMGSPQAAYAAMQDVAKGRVLDDFGRAHNRLRPDKPVRLGRTSIRGDLQHLDALDPAARDKRLAEHRGLVDRLRNRAAGRYASGSVADKVAAAREAEEAAAQSQMGLFGDEPQAGGGDADAPLPENTVPLGIGERTSLGHVAERTLAGMAQTIGRNFRPGQPADLYRPDMSGKFVARQRAIKLAEHNRRLMLGAGVGSGKTAISLGAFTHMQAKGKAKRGLFLVPSVVQGQFHGEALALLEPGRYQWHANPGASRDERIAALKDPANHFNVLTHAAFRDDVLHLAAQQGGTTPEAVADRISEMAPAERQAFIKDTLQREGIDHDFLAVDEGHNLLNRQGKQNSRMAQVIDGVADGMGTYLNMTADPVKNDASEVFDTLAKMDRARYSDRDAFMRKYGVDTESAREGLRREMARHYFTSSIPSGIQAHKKQISVPLHEEDRARVEAVQHAAGQARLARMEGRVDLGAMKILSPGSFDGVPPEQHEEVARRLQDAIGVIRDSALAHAINGRGKIEALAREASARKGRPGVVFAHSLERVDQLAERLKADGHRVVTLTGKHGAKEKAKIVGAFKRGEHDILIASDAGAVGANLQKGKWLSQFDTPQTAMVHAQRNGRIDRFGQTEDVELLDLVADHPVERRNRERLSRKYQLREIATSPLDGIDDTGLAGMIHRIRAGKAEAEGQPQRGSENAPILPRAA